ncbi:hypothetical protein RA307_04900 [Xanthobacteraceae bacterium Astr-EGSB]|uniref:hypothetical protein n=1 Tax=Astrobacterium formosum TaxID=3069710 RepID=UPI0027B0F380|nr:hypothetical protein [Xanthobacteraceae bacterium Astr-EGSB]
MTSVTLHDLRRQIETTGRYDHAMVMRVAMVMARGERDADRELCRRSGWSPLPWRKHLAAGLRRAWDWARTYKDGHDTAIAIAAMTPAEREARRLELAAELNEGAIPPRFDDAARCRALAAQVRAADLPRLQAAE